MSTSAGPLASCNSQTCPAVRLCPDIPREDLCVLHSPRLQWKSANHFSHWLHTYVRIARSEPIGMVDLQRVHFMPSADEPAKNKFDDRQIDCTRLDLSGDIDFSSARFHGWARFVGARFGGQAYFRDAWFKCADFAGATFREAYFERAHFETYADFEGASFDRHVYFERARFERRAYFQRVKFASHAAFRHVTFEEQANFTGIQVRDWTFDASHLKVGPSAEVLFCGASPTDRLFAAAGSDLVRLKLTRSEVQGTIVFENADLSKVRDADALYGLAESSVVELRENCGSSFNVSVAADHDGLSFTTFRAITEALAKFLVNENVGQFDVSYRKVDGGYIVEFSSVRTVRKAEMRDSMNRFSEAFAKALVDELCKDRHLRDLISDSREVVPARRIQMSELTDVEVELDACALAKRFCALRERGLLNKVRFRFGVNLGVLSFSVGDLALNRGDKGEQ